METVTVKGKKYTLKDLGEFHIQRRGFPSILHIGKTYGEGQSGGRTVSDIAHEVENKFVSKLGSENYQTKMEKTVSALDRKVNKQRKKFIA